MRNRFIVLCLISLLVSFPALAQDVRIEKDVAYLGPDRIERLDLYFPGEIADGARFPAVVIIHGGGWTGGD
ncbi:MAG TPA: alpha/beta hydrolase, partial [Planctomycetaceae bacterium]|nr:alpha/beta hydrolase [Planctomycetaceae bacterium]